MIGAHSPTLSTFWSTFQACPCLTHSACPPTPRHEAMPAPTPPGCAFSCAGSSWVLMRASPSSLAEATQGPGAGQGNADVRQGDGKSINWAGLWGAQLGGLGGGAGSHRRVTGVAVHPTAGFLVAQLEVGHCLLIVPCATGSGLENLRFCSLHTGLPQACTRAMAATIQLLHLSKRLKACLLGQDGINVLPESTTNKQAAPLAHLLHASSDPEKGCQGWHVHAGTDRACQCPCGPYHGAHAAAGLCAALA